MEQSPGTETRLSLHETGSTPLRPPAMVGGGCLGWSRLVEIRRTRGEAIVRAYCRESPGRENPNVRPIVNCQSGAARLMPRRTPASRNTFFDVGCQMTPKSAELVARWSF